MNRSMIASVIAAISVSATGGAALATPLPACSGADISVAGATCLGFFDGNLNGNSASWVDVNARLTPWSVILTGAAAPDHMLGNLSVGNATHRIDFSQQMYGDTIIGIHYGNIGGGANNVTAFYRFDAGQGIDAFTTSYASLSNATLYRTSATVPPASISVPEPATTAMLVSGLGLIGFMARRRKSK
jgi:hypothetical protein